MRPISRAGKSSKTTSGELLGSNLAGSMYTRVKVKEEARCKAGADSKTKKMQMRHIVGDTILLSPVTALTGSRNIL